MGTQIDSKLLRRWVRLAERVYDSGFNNWNAKDNDETENRNIALDRLEMLIKEIEAQALKLERGEAQP